MNSAESSNSSSLDDIIAEYLAAVEAGNPPSTDELIAAHPAFAQELRNFLADKKHIDELAGAVSGGEKTPVDATTETLPPRPRAVQKRNQEPNEFLVFPVEKGSEMVHYFGDYEILEEIARGGMGVVYKARQVSLNRIVALKMILSGQLASRDEVKRFYAEAEAAANLDHPGIVPIYEVGLHEGQHYYSMSFVDGQNLGQRLADGPFSTKEAARLVCKVAEAVAFAHKNAVVHRDLKPGNILIPNGDGSFQPRVTDFGLAKRIDVNSDLTATGQIFGTPGYMAPEQASGKIDQVNVLSDVYSLGAILYALLTGRPPFQAETPIKTMHLVMEREPISPRNVNPDVPRDVETICLKCLERNHTAASSRPLIWQRNWSGFSITSQSILAELARRQKSGDGANANRLLLRCLAPLRCSFLRAS